MHNRNDDLTLLAQELLLNLNIDWDYALLLAAQMQEACTRWGDDWDDAAARQWSQCAVAEWEAMHRG